MGLHFDAMSGGAETSWSKENFLPQRRWLLGEAGAGHIAADQNHDTRWEWRAEFLRAKGLGIPSDQTRGMARRADGFPLGGSQPSSRWTRGRVARLLDVLEVNLLTQELGGGLPGRVSPAARRFRRAASRGGQHFLFHPDRIVKPGEADVLGGLVGCMAERRGWSGRPRRSTPGRRPARMAAAFEGPAGSRCGRRERCGRRRCCF